MIRGIHHVALNTRDIETMRDFYVDILGFDQVTEWHSWADDEKSDNAIGLKDTAARHVFIRAGNLYLELFQYTNPPARDSDALRPCDRGYTHFAIDVTDIDAEYARLSAAGMRFAAKKPVDFGPIRAVYGWDPEGNVIEIQEIDDDQLAAFERLSPRSG